AEPRAAVPRVMRAVVTIPLAVAMPGTWAAPRRGAVAAAVPAVLPPVLPTVLPTVGATCGAATPGMVALPVFGRGAVRPAVVPRGCIARGWVARPGAVRAGVVRAGVARVGIARPWPAGVAGGASGPGETRPGMCPAAAGAAPGSPDVADVTAGADGASAGAAIPGTTACPVRW